MHWSAVIPFSYLLLGLFRRNQGGIGRHRHESSELGIQGLDAFQIGFSRLYRGYFLGCQQRGQLSCTKERKL